MCAQNKYAAQRALQRNGEQLSPSLMVGVKPLDPVHRAAIHDYQEVIYSPPTYSVLQSFRR